MKQTGLNWRLNLLLIAALLACDGLWIHAIAIWLASGTTDSVCFSLWPLHDHTGPHAPRSASERLLGVQESRREPELPIRPPRGRPGLAVKESPTTGSSHPSVPQRTAPRSINSSWGVWGDVALIWRVGPNVWGTAFPGGHACDGRRRGRQGWRSPFPFFLRAPHQLY